jgi:eukaryotic-like serine/threonine-protein kinase
MGANAPAIACPRCGQRNTSGSPECWRCHSSLAGITPSEQTVSDGNETVADRGTWASARPAAGPSSQSGVVPGVVLAERYEILSLLGQGGMGSVYKARDIELDRLVALKVIRADLASNPKVLQRFKQELILARRVTHRNVIRIFDLGIAGDTKFITMDFIDGQDLSHILGARKVTRQEAVQIAIQIALALEAAQSEGVIHRDLKPQNVMVDSSGKVSVMDFGLARTAESHGMTQTGMLMGTPAYMSPEQAKGEPLDARSDIYAFGIILYEMLTGTVPFQADSMLATLLKRTQEPPPPPIEIDPTVPQDLSDVVVKCTAVDREERYQTASEILADLQTWHSGGTLAIPLSTGATGLKRPSTGARPVAPAPVAAESPSRRKFVRGAAAACVLLLAAGAWFFRDRFAASPKTANQPVTTLVADFDNATGDSVFDGALEPMMTVALEGASFISSYNRGAARQLLTQVKPGATRLDPDTARLIAVREGLNAVISGSLRKEGEEYLITAKAVDAVKGTVLVASEAKASSREDVLKAVSKLMAPIRRALGDKVPESAQLAAAETFSSSSLAAVQAYSRGQDAQLLGKTDEAIQQYTEAIKLDPNFGRAYSGLGVIYRNLRQREEAEKYFTLALKNIGQMSERERYRTRGAYYVTVSDYSKARDEFTRLVAQFPADSAGHANLAIAYLHLREIPKAIEEGRRAVAIYPRNASQRLNLALYLLYAGEFEAAQQEAAKALEINPKYEPAILVIALSDIGSGRTDQAEKVYARLQQVSPRGASMSAVGLADLALYQGRSSDAVTILQKGIEDDLAAKNASAASRKQVALAYAHLQKGLKTQAVAAADKAASGTKDLGALVGAAMTYVVTGQEAKASAIAEQLKNRLELEPQAYGRLIEGALLSEQGKFPEAIRLYRDAQKLLDTWAGRFLLGQAYLGAKAFTEADSEFDLCQKRKGEVTDLFFDYVPTTRYLPLVQYYRGRVLEGLGSPSAREAYGAFLETKAKGEPDANVLDAKRRLAKP